MSLLRLSLCMVSKIVPPSQRQKTKGTISETADESDLCISLIHFNCVSATVKTVTPNVSLYKLLKNILQCKHMFNGTDTKCFTYHINRITFENKSRRPKEMICVVLLD